MPKASPKTDLPNEPASYELALEELEQLVGRIESGQMPWTRCWRATSGRCLAGVLPQAARCCARPDQGIGRRQSASVGARMSAAMTPASLPAWDLNGWSKHHLGRVEDAPSRWVGIEAPAGLGDAMRYAVLDGGKRLRPCSCWRLTRRPSAPNRPHWM